MTSYRLIDSPLGAMLLRAQDNFLTGVYFEGQKYYPAGAVPGVVPESAARLFDEAARQIAAYFDGSLETFSVPMRLVGTSFQTRVWEALRTIAFGETMSYGDLAGQLGLPHGHARAVGGAVGRNPLSVIVPSSWTRGWLWALL